MNVGLSALGFKQGKMGGTETYFRNLLRHLPQIDKNNSFNIICDLPENALEFQSENATITSRLFHNAKPSLGWLLRGVLKRGIGVDSFKIALDNLKLDLIHYPFTVVSPLGLRTPTVLTFWDMQHEFYPEFFSKPELNRRNASYRASVENATKIIVSAEFTKNCLVDKYEADPEKISVVYTGFGSEYHVIQDATPLDKFRTKYKLNRPFLYYPAATWPHKNHKTLLAALKILKEKTSFEGILVLTGIAQHGQSELLGEIESLGLADIVIPLGYLPYEELPFLYNLARLLVFPSFFEGFGIPIVEAMACGCPVVCANATSLPEVAGDCALLFDPYSPEEMAATILRVWDSDALRSGMSANGLERAKLFNWLDTARDTLDVYKSAVVA